MPKWEADNTHIIYRRFEAGESLVGGLETFALEEGIKEAAITSCIGSFRQLRLRNLCRHDAEGLPEFERSLLDENLELVSAEGYIQPLPEGGIRVHIHVAAARPSGEMVGGHCEEATTYTGAFMYLHVLDTQV
ncbi:MAG: DNA-binding protein [Dehalococcoidia bacterium]|nr:DNA-binding protein [Dehalococcoidia bacterium]MYA63016.1 DNA-binding protein [Dehalococcoidia bacterium]